MAKSKSTFNKKQIADKKRKKQKEKLEKRLDKKHQETASFESMIMYVDADGNFSSTPPPKPEEEE
jgi:hypothetical protein